MVTERECELIMSIFMHAVQGGDAIQDHFYEKDKENTPNINYKLLDEFKCFIIQVGDLRLSRQYGNTKYLFGIALFITF